ncbi:hypothetical protein ACI8AK_05070 [Geodermatophilus sp. SYSU D00867]
MRQQSRAVACADCTTDRTDVPDDEPCPACGRTAKAKSVTLNDFSRTTDQIPELEIRPDQQPRWWERWERVLRALDRLKKAYTPSAGLDREDMRRRVDEFFLDCWSLGDWLINDDRITPRISRGTIDHAIKASRALTICGGYANTAKHRTRKSPTHMEARISSFKMWPKGHRVQITYRSQNQRSTNRDALRLAQQCVADWRRFLKAHGLRPPAT